jgi:flagellar biosynthetic protein FliP
MMDGSESHGLLDALASAGPFQELAQPLQIALFLGSFVLVPAALVSVTAFTRIIIVFSFVRRALTMQEIPPNQVVIGLSLIMTMFVMGPTFDSISTQVVSPYLQGNLGTAEAVRVGTRELVTFMLRETRVRDLELFIGMANIESPQTPEDTPFRVLMPAFVISELKTAFTMGFCIYVPFLLIDLLVSTVLMSLGMMMMPPVVIAAPFKVLLFVLVDGWHLIAQALATSFVV